MRGVLVGAGYGFLSYLMRESNARKHAELEARERSRIHAQMYGKANSAKTMSRWFLLLALAALIGAGAGALVVNLSLVAPLLSSGGDTSSNSKPSATISDYGRYRNTGPIRVVPDRKTTSGVSAISDRDFILLEQTDQIPCQVGETWGFRIRCSDIPANLPYTVRKETYHPPIKQSDGSVRTKDVNEFRRPPGASFDPFCGWYFLKGYEYELVAGEWTLVVFIDDVEVARKVFKIQN
ncbi:hypothetical protein FRUB_01421 [Fimbriiglobus ruber]|uniref:DUF3859 domain-containing protein n=1 Tax=Fimbriiglobus ruber TaxID=1908690 RepID=A0A225DU87_9BACT|nr:hypothetical protein FRUB_01421 [Fimbriiglobus ruber]